jgi:aminoglycoside phosphotransferase (APT) family kinase protein
MMPPHPLVASEFPEEVAAVLGTIRRLRYPAQGDTSALAIVEGTGGLYAVKRARGERFSGWLSQEYQALSALAQTALPTPQPRAFVQREVAGVLESWLVMDYLPGETLLAAIGQTAERAARHRLLSAFGAALAAIHQTPIPAALRGDGTPWLDRMLERAEHALRHYPIDGNAALLETLEQRRPAPVAPTLIHGDFTADNVLALAGKVTGIIDWAGGGPGDPRYDLALAIRPLPTGLFQTPADRQAFFEGYGLSDLSASELDYFLGLYEFF